MTDLFVYGTLKRGGANHQRLASQTYLGTARTVPGYRLFALGDYPGMVPWPEDCDGVAGEIWRVDPASLANLDDFEGISEGLYRRETVRFLAPSPVSVAQTYLYARSIEGRKALGGWWRV